MAASPQASSSSSVLKRRDSPIISLELDMSSFPSVLDRAFVMGHASPYRRSSAESELDFILEEDFEADSDNELGPQANRGSRSETSFKMVDNPLATPPASPQLGTTPLGSARPYGRSPSYSLPPSPLSPSVSQLPTLEPLPRHRIPRKPPPVFRRSPPNSPPRFNSAPPPSTSSRASAGRTYGGRKDEIERNVKTEYKSETVLDPTNVKSPSSSAFWAGLDDDDD